MTLLFRIVYAAHANGTHHKLALDALRYLRTDEAEKWSNVFLNDVELFLQGSKAPDKEFKDFRNHVLHVGDNYWGGAPAKARSWYGHLVDALKAENWSEAVWCAGVLSHYYTDPIMPLHTAQSEAEGAVHRGIEWSINKSYDELRVVGERMHEGADVVLPEGDDWLENAVILGAETSNPHYETLISHYDVERGAADPKTGLNDVARNAVAGLLIYASIGFARILERAIKEADVTPPDIELTAQTVVASLKIPVKWVERKLTDAADRKQVRAMFDELMETGTVERTLPEDDRKVRDAHRLEVLEPREAQQRAARQTALRDNVSRRKKPNGAGRAAASGLTELDKKRGDTRPKAAKSPVSPPPELPEVPTKAGKTGKAPPPVPHAVPPTRLAPSARFYLAASDAMEEAPSIGPKTAARLATVGLLTVNDLLNANAKEVAREVKMRHITAQKISDWQDQSRLVMGVPGLRGTHAQLLVGAGFRSAKLVAQADAADLAAAILTFATTSEGQRILRDGNPPDLEKTKTWIEGATQALAA